MVFQRINIRQVPLEVLKTEACSIPILVPSRGNRGCVSVSQNPVYVSPAKLICRDEAARYPGAEYNLVHLHFRSTLHV